MTFVLHSFFNCSTSYRVRIALALKGVAHDVAGAHRQPAFTPGRNATAAVPVLTGDNGFSLGQSLAIIDWLDTHWPKPRLVPLEPLARRR